MATEQDETSRTTVRTYVPSYQKDAWREHAAELDMSQSEFVRTMVQAGRRGFNEPVRVREEPGPRTNSDEPGSSDTNPGGNDLETRLQEILDPETYRSWDDLIEELTQDIEARLDAALQDLMAENRVTHSGRHGGYTLEE